MIWAPVCERQNGACICQRQRAEPVCNLQLAPSFVRPSRGCPQNGTPRELVWKEKRGISQSPSSFSLPPLNWKDSYRGGRRVNQREKLSKKDGKRGSDFCLYK